MTANAPAPKQSTFEPRVLEVIRLLLRELGSQRALQSLSLQTSLEKELGLGSLERVELIDRLEREFAVQLPDELLTEAETPADLVNALLHRASARKDGSVSELSEVAARRAPQSGRSKEAASSLPAPELARTPTLEPAGVETLNAALLHHARLDPSKPHVHLYDQGQELRTLSYSALLAGAWAVSSGLAERGLRAGQTVALMLPTSDEFFFAFMGILLAGGIPVPIYPPFKANRLEEYAQRQSRILQNAEVRFLITFRQAEKLAKLLRAGIPTLKEVLAVADLSRPEKGESDAVQQVIRSENEQGRRSTRDSIALIQYTSGSTGDPKGVVLTHANLIANIRAIGAAINLQPADVGVSWLPLYHDMGLIGSWLCALYFGVPIVILSPLAFLSSPERWLWAIHRHRGTVSPAPNFAYELCARKIDERSIEGLDLSSWRAALNGAEPVSPETLERFTRRFEPYGFRPEALLPVYGLAESSVALTFPPLGRRPRVDCIEREHFEKTGEAQSCSATDSAAVKFVSEGKPIAGHEIRVVDDNGVEVGERRQGHIQFRGPSAMQGYFRNPAATQAVMQNGWVETGDLGYVADGELYVTARLKDVIIKGGRNLYPQEIEEVASQVGGVRRGCVAAFGVPDAAMGTERLVVVAETRETRRDVLERITSEVIARTDALLGLPPDVVRLVSPQTVPKTSSGKIRREACRQMYLSGELDRKPPAAWLQVSRLTLASVLSRLRQSLIRGRGVLYGVYVWLVVALVLVPGWLLVLLVPSRSRARPFSILRRLCRFGLRLARLSPNLQGEEHLETAFQQLKHEGRAFLLVSNHSSYVDPVVVAAVCPFVFRFVAKSEAASWPFIGTFIRKCGFLTVNREDPAQSARVSESIAQELKRGVAVHVFPEATFTPDAGLRPFQMGAFKAAVEAGCPILPLTLAGTRKVLRDGTWLPQRGPIRVTASGPLWPRANDWREIVRLRDAVREEFLKYCGEAPLDLILAGPPR